MVPYALASTRLLKWQLRRLATRMQLQTDSPDQMLIALLDGCEDVAYWVTKQTQLKQPHSQLTKELTCAALDEMDIE